MPLDVPPPLPPPLPPLEVSFVPSLFCARGRRKIISFWPRRNVALEMAFRLWRRVRNLRECHRGGITSSLGASVYFDGVRAVQPNTSKA